jgi:hypothetical protein
MIFPALTDSDRKAILASLRNTGTLGRLLALLDDPVH